MTIIDRYVLRLFLKVLAVCFVSFTGLFIVVDAFGNLEEFLEFGAKRGNLLLVFAEYYGARTLSFFDRTSSLLAMISSMFVLTWMQRNNELTAVMSAGVPRMRIVKPLLIAAASVSLLAIVNREFFVPAVREKLSHNIQDPEGSMAQKLQPRWDHRTNILLNGGSTFFGEKRIAEPRFRIQSEALAAYGRQIAATNAYYRPASGDRPSGYLLTEVSEPENLAELDSVRHRSRDVILSPKDTPWLKPNECFVVSDVQFDLLTGGSAWKSFSSSLELVRGLRNPSLDFSADVRVTLHSRFVQPLLDVTLLLLGLPLVLRQENRNIFVAAGLGLAIVSVFFLVLIACHAMGANYLLTPVQAAWAPLLIFAPFAYAVFRSLLNE